MLTLAMIPLHINSPVESLAGALINWKSIRQHFISISSAEEEFAALSILCIELVWFKQLAHYLGIKYTEPILVREDNQATITKATSPRTKARFKHTDIQY